MNIWMDVDTALAAVPVNVMPLIDDTDFKSIEASVAYNATGLTLLWNFVTTAGAFTQTAVTPTTSGVYDWTNKGNGLYSIEIPASGGASINNDTEGFGWFSGVATGVLPWRGPVIGLRAAALNNSNVDGTTIDVNVTAMATDSLTAAALKADAVTEIQNGLATPTNITAGTITTVTNLTNLPAITTNWLTGTGVDASAVTKLQANLALEATLTAIKGAGWTTETLAAIDVLIDAIKATVDTNLDAAVSTRLATAGYTAPPTVGDIATAVWANATRSLTTFGTLIADIWSYVTRTLTSAGSGATAQEVWEYATRALTDKAGFGLATDAVNSTSLAASAVTEIAAAIDLNPVVNVTGAVAVSAAEAALLANGKYALTTSYTFHQAVPSTLSADLSTATKIWCVIKTRGDDDANGLIFIEKTAGLTVVNRAAYATVANGSLTVSGTAGDWLITTDIDETASALLEAHADKDFIIGWKALVGGDAIPIADGEIRILRGSVDAIA